jgi:hypothetical protein
MSVPLNEPAEADVWLQSYLETDPTLASIVQGVFSAFIGTSEVPMPIVRFFLIEQNDLMVVNAQRVWSELVYQVEGITAGYDVSETREISRRLDELLHRLQGQSSSTIFVQEVWRRQPLFRREIEGGQPYAYAGGEYVFRVTGTA